MKTLVPLWMHLGLLILIGCLFPSGLFGRGTDLSVAEEGAVHALARKADLVVSAKVVSRKTFSGTPRGQRKGFSTDGSFVIHELAISDKLLAPGDLERVFCFIPIGTQAPLPAVTTGSRYLLFLQADLGLLASLAKEKIPAVELHLAGSPIYRVVPGGLAQLSADGQALTWPPTWGKQLHAPGTSVQLANALGSLRAVLDAVLPRVEFAFATTGSNPWSLTIEANGSCNWTGRDPLTTAEAAQLWSTIGLATSKPWPHSIGSSLQPGESFWRFEIRTLSGVHRAQVFEPTDSEIAELRATRRSLGNILEALPLRLAPPAGMYW